MSRTPLHTALKMVAFLTFFVGHFRNINLIGWWHETFTLNWQDDYTLALEDNWDPWWSKMAKGESRTMFSFKTNVLFKDNKPKPFL